MLPTEPPRDCPLCPRLVAHREALRAEHPDWWNASVSSFGDPDPWLAIIGLAPGRTGANRTGRVFTGDGSGALLFDTLAAHGLASGSYTGDTGDDLRLHGVLIVNAVRCLPPANKPTPEETRTCRRFLDAQLHALPRLRIVVALGQVAHQSAVKAIGGKLPKCRFAHMSEHRVPDGRTLIGSYHPSRYNQNTGRLTPDMFDAVIVRAVALGLPPLGNG